MAKQGEIEIVDTTKEKIDALLGQEALEEDKPEENAVEEAPGTDLIWVSTFENFATDLTTNVPWIEFAV